MPSRPLFRVLAVSLTFSLSVGPSLPALAQVEPIEGLAPAPLEGIPAALHGQALELAQGLDWSSPEASLASLKSLEEIAAQPTADRTQAARAVLALLALPSDSPARTGLLSKVLGPELTSRMLQAADAKSAASGAASREAAARFAGEADAIRRDGAERLSAAALPPDGAAAKPALELADDEGMWTFDNPPVERLQKLYGFTPTQEWLDRLRLSSVRFNDGGSGSFVSADGLVLTNHHVAAGQLYKMSTQEKDYHKDGFLARSRAEEMKCPDLELNVLVSMENVTARVNAAVPAGLPEAEAGKKRRAAIAEIEKESTEKTGLRSDVVDLYHGGEFWVYRYKKYTDIRLVMAPEFQAAFYGGFPDNFTYPRHDLDFAFFRVYEDGRPIRPPQHLRWNAAGAKEGELVFVSGHPGATGRLKTEAQLRFDRDLALPIRVEGLQERLKALEAYSKAGEENKRRALKQYFSIENSRKAITGFLAGLRDPAIFEKKAEDERILREAVAADPELARMYGAAWDKMSQAQAKYAERFKELGFRTLGGSDVASLATTIVRYVTEVQKPNGERLEEFRDSALESLRFRLFSSAPIYLDLEETLLALSFDRARRYLGASDPFIQEALRGKTPAEAAREAIAGTKLTDPAYRKALVEGGPEAVAKSDDPLIQLALRVDPILREARKWLEDEIEPAMLEAGSMIAKARFAVFGKSLYPDATFTLRLSHGRVAGYVKDTKEIPYKTTFWGLFGQASSFDGKEPYQLAGRLAAAKDRIDMDAPVNFTTTNDTIGGNSGSPVVNRAGELVGLIFDGNIDKLVAHYAYNSATGRTVSVHTGGMLEALSKAYGAHELVEELTKGPKENVPEDDEFLPPLHNPPGLPPAGFEQAPKFVTRGDFHAAYDSNYVKSATHKYVHRSIFSRTYKTQLARLAMDYFVKNGLISVASKGTVRKHVLPHEIPLPEGRLDPKALAAFFARAGRPAPQDDAKPFLMRKKGVRPDGTEWTWEYAETFDPWGEQRIQVSLVEENLEKGNESVVSLSWVQRELRGFRNLRWEPEAAEAEAFVGMNPIGYSDYLHSRTRAPGLSVSQKIGLKGEQLSLSNVEVAWPLSSSPESAVAQLKPGFTVHHGAVARLIELSASLLKGD